MDFLLSNPLILWMLGALVLVFLYQRFAPQLKVRMPGIPTADDLVAKFLPGVSAAKFQRRIAALKKSGNFIEAGRILEDNDQLAEAIEAYSEGQEYIAAAATLEKMGKHERAGDMYLQGGDYKKAAQVFSQAGKHARAAQLFQEKGNNLEAARLFGLANQWDKSAALYMKGGFAMRAAEAYEKCGEPAKAAEAYEKHFMENVSYAAGYSSTAGSPEQKAALLAGRLYEKAGDVKHALQIFERGGYYKEAGEACLKAGQAIKAAELFMRAEQPALAADAYEQGGDAVQAALLRGEVAFKKGKMAEAAAFFQKGQDYLRAAELFESADMLAEAAGAYEAGDSFAAAGGVYVRAGLKDRAAGAFEKGGDYENAAKLYEEIGQTAKAIELFDRAGHTFKSGESAAKGHDHEHAIALLQRVPAGDENYLPAAALLAESFIATRRPALAIERLQKAIGGQAVNPANLALFYWLGAAYEAAGKATEALAQYKKVQAEDVGFKDVESRVLRLASGESLPTGPVAAGAPAENRIGKYVLGEKIGQGAMGEVFRAHDPGLKRDVAIKMISATLAAESDLRTRFEREAQSAARLNHPNIITVYEFGQERGKIFLAMELLAGNDLRTVINRHALATLDEKLAIMDQICEGLAYAHANEVVHRDLKPGNIHILPSRQAKILDFGLARLGASEMTQSGVIMGTPNYMSPEQVRGDRADARSDVFALGAVFYEMLSNRKAFEAESMHGVLYHVLNDEPEPVRKWVPDLPDAVIGVIEKALAKDPARRFKDGGEMRDALRAARRALAASPMAAAPRAAAPVPAAAPMAAAPVAAAATAPPAAAHPSPAPSTPAPSPSAAPAPAASVPPAAGKGGRFIPQEEIGRGPKGIVFRGGDANAGAGQAVALRFLDPEVLKVDGALAALAADLKAAAGVVHPNLVKLVGFVEIGGKRCVVTELVPGQNFAGPLQGGRRVPFAHILKLTRALAETLQLIHARSLVHGSVSPSNLMAAGGVVKLADFGLGRVFQKVSRAKEYWPAEGRLDAACDLYAAAATVYHLLTGVHPKARPGALTAPSALIPGVPATFDALLLRALDPKLENRFGKAADLVQTLDQLSGPQTT